MDGVVTLRRVLLQHLLSLSLVHYTTASSAWPRSPTFAYIQGTTKVDALDRALL